MRNVRRLIVACAILIAALTLLIPLNEIEHGDNYADEGLADDSLVLGEEENKSTIDWNNCPIKLSYSFDEIYWIEIPLFYDRYPLISYTIHEDALDLRDMTDDDVIYMKAEPTSGYSAASGDSTIQIEKFGVSWWHTSLEDVTLNYTGFVKLQDNEWTWQVPVSTLGKCDDYDYLSIGFYIGDTNCQCNLYNKLNSQKIIFLSLDSPRSIQSDLDALVGTYVYGDQTIQIYKNGDEYVKRIVGEISKGQPVKNKIGDMYYTLDENGIKETLVTVGYTNNIYLSIDKNSDVILSLTAIDDYTYSSANPSAETISKGSVFERISTGISIDGFEYPDIQTAIDCAKEGDVIELDVGEYHLDNFITIDKNITLKGIIGETKETSSVITGFQGSSTVNPVVNIRIESSATLDSIWIDIDQNVIGANGDNLNGMRGVIDLGDSVNAKVMNSKFTKSTSSEAGDQSTAVYAGSGSLIENNYFSGWIKAIYSENNNNPKTIVIKNNIFENNTYGIQIALTPNYQIINNVISGSNISISGENAEFNNNQFYNVTLKVYSSSVIILNNAFMGTFEVINKNSAGELIDVSGNYWGGAKPALDDSKFKFDSWYTTYDESTRTLGGLTFEDGASKIFVDCNNESEGDGTESNPYKTISEALANVKYGQEIHVAAGTYDEKILIISGLRNVTLIGSNYGNNANGKSWNQNGTILTGGIYIETRGTHEDPNPNIVDGLTIKGFDFKNKGFVVVGWWQNGSISNIIIENNRFTNIDDGSNAAIHFNLSESMAVNNLTISNNYIRDIGTANTERPSGIHIAAVTGTVVIDNNYILNTNHGSIQILTQSSGTLKIINNHLENWDFDQKNGGRAFKFTFIKIDEVLIKNNSLVQKSDFNGEDLSDMYLKITGSNTYIAASENYWDGKDPKVENFPIYAGDGCIVEIHSWYTQYDPETNTLSGLVDDDIPGFIPDIPDVPSVPDVPDVPTTPEVPTPDENGDVSVEIPKTDIDKIVDDAVSSGSNSVTITDVSDIENVSSVTISKDDLQNVLDKLDSEDSISEAVVTLPEGSVSIGKDVLSSILETSGEESLTIKVSDAKNELNEEQQKIVGDRPVYNITMMSGSEKITSFNGKTITISIPYELKENEDPDNIVVYYVKDDGTIEKMNCTYKDGKVSFETDHLSYFAISYEVPEPVPEEPANNDNDNTIYYVIAAVVILLAIIAAAYFITKRKQ